MTSNMSANMSRLARNNSFNSISSTPYGPPTKLTQNHPTNHTSSSIDPSSHNHILSHLTAMPKLPTWLEYSWLPHNSPHERIATGTLKMGMAVLTREMMEMHIQQAPDVKGMVDCLPVVDKSQMAFVGWRQKLGTWPLGKRESLAGKGIVW